MAFPTRLDYHNSPPRKPLSFLSGCPDFSAPCVLHPVDGQVDMAKGQAITGRHCNRNNSPSAMAHSISTGVPVSLSCQRAIIAIADTCASSRQACPRKKAGTATSLVPPGTATVIHRLCLITFLRTLRSLVFTIIVSGFTVPPTMLSPKPQLAVITISSAERVAGLRLNASRADHLKMRTMPSSPFTSTSCPSRIASVALCAPTTAGIRYSRATTALWLKIPPVSVTTAATLAKRGVQGGAVVSAMRMSPGISFSASASERTTFATPRAVPGEPALPLTIPSGGLS